jgi:hypothetical protein
VANGGGYIREGEQPELRPTSYEQPPRRPALIFPPKDQQEAWKLDGTILRNSEEFPTGFELGVVNVIRERLEAWEQAGYPGITRTTSELSYYAVCSVLRVGLSSRCLSALLNRLNRFFRLDFWQPLAHSTVIHLAM